MRAQPQKRGVLGAGTTRKRGVLGTSTTRKRGNLELNGSDPYMYISFYVYVYMFFRHIYNPKKGEFRTDLVKREGVRN